MKISFPFKCGGEFQELRSTHVGPLMAERLVSDQWGSGKGGDVLDRSDVRAHRPKGTNDHSVAPLPPPPPKKKHWEGRIH